MQTLRRVCLIRLPGGLNITISIVVSCEWNYPQRLQEVYLCPLLLATVQHYARGLRHHDSLDYSGILPKNPYLENSRRQLRVRTFLRWAPKAAGRRRSRLFPGDWPPPGIVDDRVVLGLDLPEEPAADHGEHDGPGPENHEVCRHAEMGHIDEGAPQGIHPV